MVHYRGTSRQINRPAAEVFDIVGTHAFEYQPQWEEEVVEVRRLTPPPMGVGSRAIMVRDERGKRKEVEYEVVGFEPGHRVDYHHNVTDADFDLSISVRALSTDSSDITAELTMKLHGLQRMLEPLIGLGMPKVGGRILVGMADVAETAPAHLNSPRSNQ